MSKYITMPQADYEEAIRALKAADIDCALSILKNRVYTSSSVCPSSSMPDMLETVKTQIEYNYFSHEDREIDEICLIIAEVLISDSYFENGTAKKLKINGSPMNADIVKEIYRQLTHAHVELVLNNFKDITSKIYNKKAYLQTSLYNSVFELDLHYSNQVQHDRYGF